MDIQQELNNFNKRICDDSTINYYIDLFRNYKNYRTLIYLDSTTELYLHVSSALIVLGIPQLLLSKNHHTQEQLNFFKNKFNADLIINDLFLSKNQFSLSDEKKSPTDNFHKTTNQSAPTTNNLMTTVSFLTSGTTGQAKIVEHSLSSLIYSAKGTTDFYSLTEKDIWAITLPVHHIGGYMIYIRSLVSNFNYKQFDWKELFKKKSNCTIYSFIPLQIEQLIENKLSLKNLKKAKLIILSGSKISKKLFKRLQELNLNISPSYGMTEAASQVAAMTVSEFKNSKYLYFKNTLPYRCINVDSNFANNKNTGVSISGKTLFNGYYPYLKKITKFKTSDIVSFDSVKEEYTIIGRSDKIIISGSENISLSLIKTKLEKITNDRCYVTSLTDLVLGEVPIAFIPIDSDYNEYDLKILLKEILPKYHTPKHIFKIKQRDFKISNDFLLSIANIKLQNVYLMLHGFMGDPSEWNFLQKKYPDYHLICPTLPFHSKTQDTLSIKTTDPIASFFNNISNTLKYYNNINIYGYSLGGRLALEYLSQNKSNSMNVKSLILESTNPGISGNKERKTRYENDLIIFDEVSSYDTRETKNKLIAFLNNWYLAPIWGNLNYQRTILKKSKGPWKLWKAGLKYLSVGIRPDLWADINKLDIPIHYLHGILDSKYSQIAEEISKYKNVKVHSFDGCAHNLSDKRSLDL